MNKYKMMIRLDNMLTPVIRPFLNTATKRSVGRRGGVIADYQLKRRFRKVKV